MRKVNEQKGEIAELYNFNETPWEDTTEIEPMLISLWRPKLEILSFETLKLEVDWKLL